MIARARCGVLLLAAGLLIAGCRSVPPEPAPASELPDAVPIGEGLARSALALLGAPYRFGGTTPAGFDCSGLVFYVHDRAGFTVPRTAAAQRRAARPIPLDVLEAGDLVFFRISAAQVDHVGVYVGDGRFVHAPRSARPVALERLDDPYYRTRLVGAGRFWPAPR
ncbi:MAG: C40 family peptidase [Steroidobacteraceae bacterium]